ARVEAVLWRAWLRMPVVLPADLRRQRHENGLHPPHAGLQPEYRAAIVHEVELHIAAAPVMLEMLLPLAKGHILAPPEYGLIGIEVAVAHRAQEFEGPVEAPFIEVVEKQ